jgi:hypothetical protein
MEPFFNILAAQMIFITYWIGAFLQASNLASHWLEDCANFTPTPEKHNQYSDNYS